MIYGISDLDFNDTKRLMNTIIDRADAEKELLKNEMEEKIIEILLAEYKKRLDLSREAQLEKDKEIEACNKRMEEIEKELFQIANKRSYFEIQLSMLDKKTSMELL